MINATVIGNIGKAPELKTSKNGKALCNFSVASNVRRAGKEDETTWIDCVAFEEMAEGVAGNLAKGMRVVMSGNLSMEKFRKRDGSEGSSLRMVVNDIGLSIRPKKKPQESSSSDEPW